ncbi:MAG: CoA transferase [Leucobacter sp.]|nr:CoA transferase [Leucobacter sp.]
MPEPSPLAGVHVVSLATNLPGPLAAARLHELGATVTKIEPPTGDALAQGAPCWYASLTRGQTILRLDLKAQTDLDRFTDVLTRADILLTAMRPSAAERLGIPDIVAGFPRLSVIEIVGSDDAERPGHDLTHQAEHGLITPPLMPRVLIADLLGAERAVSAVLLALLNRAASGRGDHQRVSLERAAADASESTRFGLTSPGGILGGADPAYGLYDTADGVIAVAALEPHFRERLTLMTGGSSRDALERAFRTHPTTTWLRLAADADIPLVRVDSSAELHATTQQFKEEL